MKAKIILFFILLALIKQTQSKCLEIKSGYCSPWKTYSIDNEFFKDDFNITLAGIEEFEEIIQNTKYEPIKPINEAYTREVLGCSKWDISYSWDIPYKFAYQCNSMVFQNAKSCDKDEDKIKKAPKMCKESCLSYLEAIKKTLENEEICPESPAFKSIRESTLKDISTVCTSYTDSSSQCIKGVLKEGEYCGFDDSSMYDAYCDEHNDDSCCKDSNKLKNNNFDLFKLLRNIALGLIAFILLLFLFLKIYSIFKNKKEKAEKIKNVELEKKREKERDLYRKKLIKESPMPSPMLQQRSPFDSNGSMSSIQSSIYSRDANSSMISLSSSQVSNPFHAPRRTQSIISTQSMSSPRQSLLNHQSPSLSQPSQSQQHHFSAMPSPQLTPPSSYNYQHRPVSSINGSPIPSTPQPHSPNLQRPMSTAFNPHNPHTSYNPYSPYNQFNSQRPMTNIHSQPPSPSLQYHNRQSVVNLDGVPVYLSHPISLDGPTSGHPAPTLSVTPPQVMHPHGARAPNLHTYTHEPRPIPPITQEIIIPPLESRKEVEEKETIGKKSSVEDEMTSQVDMIHSKISPQPGVEDEKQIKPRKEDDVLPPFVKEDEKLCPVATEVDNTKTTESITEDKISIQSGKEENEKLIPSPTKDEKLRLSSDEVEKSTKEDGESITPSINGENSVQSVKDEKSNPFIEEDKSTKDVEKSNPFIEEDKSTKDVEKSNLFIEEDKSAEDVEKSNSSIEEDKSAKDDEKLNPSIEEEKSAKDDEKLNLSIEEDKSTKKDEIPIQSDVELITPSRTQSLEKNNYFLKINENNEKSILLPMEEDIKRSRSVEEDKKSSLSRAENLESDQFIENVTKQPSQAI